MHVLRVLGEAAAVLLLIELLVVLIVFLAVSGGLVFGLRWVRGKEAWAFDRANSYSRLGHRYVETGLNYVAKPFLISGRLVGTIEGTAEAVRREVRRLRAPQPVAAHPVPEPPGSDPDPLA